MSFCPSPGEPQRGRDTTSGPGYHETKDSKVKSKARSEARTQSMGWAERRAIDVPLVRCAEVSRGLVRALGSDSRLTIQSGPVEQHLRGAGDHVEFFRSITSVTLEPHGRQTPKPPVCATDE